MLMSVQILKLVVHKIKIAWRSGDMASADRIPMNGVQRGKVLLRKLVCGRPVLAALVYFGHERLLTLHLSSLFFSVREGVELLPQKGRWFSWRRGWCRIIDRDRTGIRYLRRRPFSQASHSLFLPTVTTVIRRLA
jgi:hypothetical protein